MSQIINELATIEISNDTVQQLDLAGIYASFSQNYKKLDELKGFRLDYEQKNRLIRWWHNDKLLDAQLDSAEVQAEFSKTIGQLMMISIMQSKKITEQQALLQEQQHKLKVQANGIADHASTLQEQHRKLADQSTELKNLVEEYIELKGLTEDGTKRLVAIAKEIKATKESLVQHVDERTQVLQAQYSSVVADMHALATELQEQTQLCMTGLRENKASQQAQNALLESSLSRHASQAAQFAAEYHADIDKLHTRVAEIAGGLSTSNGELANWTQQQQTMQLAVAELKGNLFAQVRRSGQIAAGLVAVAIATLLGGLHLAGWM